MIWSRSSGVRSVLVALVLFVLACVVSLAQMLYQYWGIQKVEELAPARTHAIARWLNAQPLVQAIRRRTLLMRFGSLAGVRRATREELVLAVGTKAASAVLAYFAENPN